ncbi:MAG: DUF4270 family protein [Chitinophagaceae bacterium]
MSKKIISPFAFLMLLVFLLTTSCKKADIKFGEEFLDNDIAQIYKTDSFSVDVSTVYMDSFITSSKGTVLVGGYTDAIFGRVNTQSYFELAPPSYEDIYANTSLDSICLILTTKNNYYGDSTIPVNIKVDELKDSINLPENNFAFYNTSQFEAKTSSLIATNTNIIVRPLSDKEVSIKLPNSFGNTILNKLKDPTDNTLKTTASFLTYFKGIKLSSNLNTQMIVGFSDAVVMRLYYKAPGLGAVHKTADFTLVNKLHQFNNISVDRAGTILGNNNFGANKREISSLFTNNESYTQAATGSMIKLTFPTIKGILQIPNFAKILKAALIVKPVKGSYNTSYFLPPNLRLSYTNQNNNLGSDLAFITNNGALSVQYGFLQTDYFLNENTQYQYDLTEYLKEVLRTTNITQGDGLLLTPPSNAFESEFARVVIGNKSNPLGKIQLVIYYAAVK